jgi:hypothetical protein
MSTLSTQFPIFTNVKSFDDVRRALFGIIQQLAYQQIDDPGDGGTINPVVNAIVAMTSGGAETRSLEDPVRVGQVLILTMAEYGGDIVVTSTNSLGVSHSGGVVLDTMTFNYDDDYAVLIGAYVKGTLVWRIANDSTGAAALS